jgi:hypothetical protein
MKRTAAITYTTHEYAKSSVTLFTPEAQCGASPARDIGIPRRYGAAGRTL